MMITCLNITDNNYSNRCVKYTASAESTMAEFFQHAKDELQRLDGDVGES